MAKVDDGDHRLPSTGLVPIRTVSSLTGVNSVTLRAWERRYALVKPVRTPKGHRLYTTADVELIQQVVSLLKRGMSIGQVRQVLEREGDQAQTKSVQAAGFDPWASYQRRLLQAIGAFDDGVLNEVYTEVLSLYPVDVVTRRLIVPLLQELGERWEQGVGSIAEEHFFSVFLRNKLGARFHHLDRHRQGAKLLMSCLPGEQHEVGILLFALAALDRDYQVLLLGSNTPLRELPPVVERAKAQAIVLSGAAELSRLVLETELPRLCRAITAPVFIGGRITTACPDALAAAGAIPLEDDLNLALRRIDATLARH